MLLKKKILFVALALSVTSSVFAGGLGLVYDSSGRHALDVAGDWVLTPFVDGGKLAAIEAGEFVEQPYGSTAAGHIHRGSEGGDGSGEGGGPIGRGTSSDDGPTDDGSSYDGSSYDGPTESF